MDNFNKEKIFLNRAEATKAERIHCENCCEQVVFLLKDNNHEFSIGLSTILECLVFAIGNGDLPKLPASWISDVSKALNISFDEDISYYDYEKFKERNPFE